MKKLSQIWSQWDHQQLPTKLGRLYKQENLFDSVATLWGYIRGIGLAKISVSALALFISVAKSLSAEAK